MTRPTAYLFRMIIFLCVVAIACFFLVMPLNDAFMSNAPLNSLILGVLILGICYNFRNVVLLYPELAWIKAFRENPKTFYKRKHVQKDLPTLSLHRLAFC